MVKSNSIIYFVFSQPYGPTQVLGVAGVQGFYGAIGLMHPLVSHFVLFPAIIGVIDFNMGARDVIIDLHTHTAHIRADAVVVVH